MEDVVIPGWALIIFGVILIPWLVWLTLRVVSNEKDTAVWSASVNGLSTELTKIYDEIKDGDEKTEARFKEMNSKLDLFIHQEITFLKQVVVKS
jgi:hypothetical protein